MCDRKRVRPLHRLGTDSHLAQRSISCCSLVGRQLSQSRSRPRQARGREREPVLCTALRGRGQRRRRQLAQRSGWHMGMWRHWMVRHCGRQRQAAAYRVGCGSAVDPASDSEPVHTVDRRRGRLHRSVDVSGRYDSSPSLQSHAVVDVPPPTCMTDHAVGGCRQLWVHVQSEHTRIWEWMAVVLPSVAPSVCM